VAWWVRSYRTGRSATEEADVAATLRGRFVEADQPLGEETTGFSLEDTVLVEADPEEAPGPEVEGERINLDMPSAVSAENWVGKEVNVEGRFDAPPEEASSRQVFVVEHIDEV
jgi:hypothetical protein